jgi:hypothetical protein
MISYKLKKRMLRDWEHRERLVEEDIKRYYGKIEKYCPQKTENESCENAVREKIYFIKGIPNAERKHFVNCQLASLAMHA